MAVCTDDGCVWGCVCVAGRPILAEFSPVTDFRESTCRQYEENICSRAGLCNFMHLKPISRALKKTLFGRYKKRRSRSRSRSRDRGGGRDDRGRDRDREDRKVRETSAERRAKIAEWNKAKEEPKEEEEAALFCPPCPPAAEE